MSKVSFIAPVYNGKKYIRRFLNSVYNQTYTDVQIIIVDDGSTDGTYDILEEYAERMRNKFSEYMILRGKNGGAAFAVNAALKHVTGTYLAWADSDDELFPNNIEEKVKFLEKNQEYGLVCCQAQSIIQDTGEIKEILSIPLEKRADNMFVQIIDGVPVYPGVFMVRTEVLFQHIINREIYYNPNAGQNYQLLLPVAYYEKCGFVDKILYNYYIRTDSHSRDVDYEKAYHRTYVREELLSNVCDFMEEDERHRLIEKIHLECTLQRFDLTFQNNDLKKNNKAYSELKVKNCITLKHWVKHIIMNCKWLWKIYKMVG